MAVSYGVVTPGRGSAVIQKDDRPGGGYYGDITPSQRVDRTLLGVPPGPDCFCCVVFLHTRVMVHVAADVC